MGSEAFQPLQLGGDHEVSDVVVTDVKGDDAYRVAGNQVNIFLLVVEGEGEDAVQILDEMDAFLAVEGQYHLAVGAGLELVFVFEPLPQLAMVVNLAVDA